MFNILQGGRKSINLKALLDVVGENSVKGIDNVSGEDNKWEIVYVG